MASCLGSPNAHHCESCVCRNAVAAKELVAHKEGWRGKLGSFLADARVLASHPIYVLTVGGTAIYVGAPSIGSSPLTGDENLLLSMERMHSSKSASC